MAKILYPVGTKVTLRQFYDGTKSFYEVSPLVVVDYIKGEENPYVTRVKRNPDAPEIRRSKEDLVSWTTMKKKFADRYDILRDTVSGEIAKSTEDVNANKAFIDIASKACDISNCLVCKDVPTQAYQDTYTTQEVNKLLADVRSEMADKLVELAEVIQTELNDVRNLAGIAYENGFVVADLTERNFKQVSRKFKTLNHDDD